MMPMRIVAPINRPTPTNRKSSWPKLTLGRMRPPNIRGPLIQKRIVNPCCPTDGSRRVYGVGEIKRALRRAGKGYVLGVDVEILENAWRFLRRLHIWRRRDAQRFAASWKDDIRRGGRNIHWLVRSAPAALEAEPAPETGPSAWAQGVHICRALGLSEGVTLENSAKAGTVPVN